jgi:hypothetical protein
MLLLTESTVFFLNLTSNRRKNTEFTLSGKVASWISGVDTTSKSKSQAAAPVTIRSSATDPPSTLFSESRLTTSSKATPQSIVSSAHAPDILDSDALVGGFADEEDDTLECQVAQAMVQTGKAAQAVMVSFHSWQVYRLLGTDTFYRQMLPFRLMTPWMTTMVS